MRAFFDAEAWYAARGVPYRRGYLFHGPPGCGKTSFVTAAAGQLDCPIYILNLAEPSLSDLGLLKLVTDAPPRSMLLMEDVDAAFHGVLAKGGAKPSAEHSQRDGLHIGQLTFSGLLNALDGVAGQEGKLVIMTSNHPEKLDAALVRPGRVDLRAQFLCASRSAIQDIFCNFFAGGSLGDEELRKTSAVYAARCAERSLPIAAIQGHLMQFRDDPYAAAKSTPPTPNEDGNAQVARQFVVPRGAAMIGGGEEE
jgi:DNA polymerase III delta prime subunit